MFEFSALALAEVEAKLRFMAAQVCGNAKQALKMRDELDAIGFKFELIL